MAGQQDDGLADYIHDVATHLYEMGIITHGHQNRPENKAAIAGKIQDVAQVLQQVSRDSEATQKSLPDELPYEPGQRVLGEEAQTATGSTFVMPEIVEYIDQGRNPSIYTREFIEATSQLNLHMRGKQEAFGSFRDSLIKEIGTKMPQLRRDLESVAKATNPS